MPILQRSLLFLFLLLMIHFPHGQKRFTERPWLRLYHRAEVLYVSPYATEKTDSLALSWYKQVIDLLTEKPEADRFLLDAYLKAGILSMGRRQNQEALKFFRGASLVKTRASFLPDTLLFKPYLFAGSVYYDLNNLDSALWFYKKAENILLQFPTVSESERLYNKLGAWYYETGDYRKSIPYFTKALSGMESKRTQDLYFIVNYRSNIASALRKMGYIDSSISIYKELLLSHINENELLHNIAVALLDENKNEEALFYLKKVSYESQARYNHMAQALLHLQKPKEAEKDLGYACQIYRKKGSPAHDFDYANTLRISGDLALAKGEIREALQLYQQSIIQLKSDFTDTSIFSNPYSFRILGNSFALFDVLTAKAKAFIQIPENGALHAFHAYEAALTLARQLELRYHSDEARFFLNDKVTPACHALVDLGIMLKEKTGDASYIDKIFRWCEGNKASVLQADIYALQLDSSSSLPVALLQESKSGKALLAKWYQQASMMNDSSTQEAIGKKITDLEIRLARIQEKLEEFPAYRELVFASRETGMDSIRETMIAEDEAMLSFYYTGRYVLRFYITKESSGVLYTPLPGGLRDKINQYRHELDAGDGEDRQVVTDLSAYLFDQLLHPVFEKIKSKKHLVIIPYNEFSYVPFESLTNPQNGNFLLNDFSVSYEYSANFLKRSRKYNDYPYKILAFAPFTDDQSVESALPKLPASRSEIESLNGTILFGRQATKSSFISLAAGFPVIHLATHAKADDIDPLQSYIEFYTDSKEQDTAHRLYEQEIYHLDMKSARLVILSACETGSGQLRNGEGVMSLSRAFSYAGCPAVITSLWKAEDQATSFISQRLHHYLSGGKPVDDALRQAKLDFLKSNDIAARYKSPAFWANLVLIGDYQPVGNTPPTRIWVLTGFDLFVLLLILWIYYKKNRRC